MLFHDTMNPVVRKGLKQADFSGCPNLRYLDLDFVPGHVGAYRSGFSAQMWGGIGIAVISESPVPAVFSLFASKGPHQDGLYTPYALIRPAAEILGLPVRAARAFRSVSRRFRTPRER